MVLINAVRDVAKALAELIGATKCAAGKPPDDPSMYQLKGAAKVKKQQQNPKADYYLPIYVHVDLICSFVYFANIILTVSLPSLKPHYNHLLIFLVKNLSFSNTWFLQIGSSSSEIRQLGQSNTDPLPFPIA